MRRIAFSLAFILGATPLQASVVKSVLTDVDLRGQATFRHIGFPIYEARLYTRGGAQFDWNADIGLELIYLRNLTQFDLVDGTMRELERSGGPLSRRAQFERCFRDVRKADAYAAVTDGANRIRFWHNGKRICTLDYPDIKTRFMGNSLEDNTRSKEFNLGLRGE